MKTDLAIIGQGAVTPAGVGIPALLQGQPAETLVPLTSRPDRQWPVFKVDLALPAFDRWRKEPRLRRASPISYFLIEAAHQALAGTDAASRAETGIVIAFSMGCLAYSRRFFESIITHGQKSASPALFPETVFNSPVSHVAATLGLEGSAYSLLGDEVSWIAALKTAALWLDQERVKQVLVMGAEEFDSAILDAYWNARCLKPGKNAFIPSEGTAGVLLRKAQPGDSKIITQLEDGFIYRTRSQSAQAGTRCLQHFDPELPWFPSAERNWLGPTEQKVTQDRPLRLGVKGQNYIGEANTASAAWNTLRALAATGSDIPRLLVPIWGSSHQIGAFELTHRI
jgi:hypothetical protein